MQSQTKNLTISGPVFSDKLRYIVGFGLTEMDISTNHKTFADFFPSFGWLI